MRNKKRNKIIVGLEVLLLCMILGILRINATSSNPPSSEVNYNKNSQTNVQNAINDLYNKVAYGDAKASDILSGKKALVGGKEIVGTYTCPTLVERTSGDATPENITEGKIAWVNGNRIVGTKTTLVDKVELGDYISYTPSMNSYTILKSDSHSDSDQIINPSKLTLWRVLRKNENGTLDIVSENMVSFGLYYCIQLFDNYVGTLNKVAKAYETNGITVRSRALGYDRTLESDQSSEGNSDLENDKRLFYGRIIDSMASYSYRNGYVTDQILLGRAGIDVWAEDLNPVKPDSLTKDSYWLASKDEYSFVHFVDFYSTYLGDKAERGANGGYAIRGIRPVVVLSTEVKITGGDGTEYSPYTIGI